jgi:hypothetical protein
MLDVCTSSSDRDAWVEGKVGPSRLEEKRKKNVEVG